MPRLDIYHNVVKRALQKDNWIITNDPLILQVGLKRLYIDLGASKLLGAKKDDLEIAVEIKSFQGKSDINDLEQALGQYSLYKHVLAVRQSKRFLYLAVNSRVYNSIFTSEIGQILLDSKALNLLVFDAEKETILQWIS